MTTSKMKIYITIGLTTLNVNSTVVPDFDDSRNYGADEPGIVGLLE
jgi:hypothetical protein